MAKQTSKNERQSKSARSNSSTDLGSIIKGLENYSNKIADSLKSRIGPGNWQFWKSNFKLEEDNQSIDLIFCSNDKKKTRYILIDVSVPHLQIGQKYLLPAKAKLFHKQHKVPLNRIKKAIILVRKGTETVSARPSRIRCPIIEVQLSRVLPQTRRQKPEKQDKHKDKREKRENKDNKTESRKQFDQVVSKDLLYALKEAIVHECLSTMHKRKNKYIRKGLWRWIEREIMDPNVHFYLIILSTIYQGKTGEVLSRKFKNVEDFSQKPEEVISAIFSRETNLADEIKKNSERHKKALKKFLACFSQTPPFEYLKSLFLKEFRSNQDGLKARLSVFTTLNQLLERCGFEGEKETQYPLEILDELGIFQGIMAGNYAKLRIINASKKLKHLVPQVEWSEEDIYQLRNQLAKALNLPSQEFNLNAFLPQAFVQDAKVLAEARKEAFRAPGNNSSKSRQSKRPAQDNTDQTHRTRSQNEDQQETKVSTAAEQTSKNRDTQSEKAPDIAPLRRDKRRPNEIDESKHRHFESFGGQTEEDIDSVRLALAMSRYEREKTEAKNNKAEAKLPEEEFVEDPNHIPPTKPGKHDLYNYNPPPPKKKKTRTSNNRNNSTHNNNNSNRGKTRRKTGRTPNKRRRRPSNSKNNSSGSGR